MGLPTYYKLECVYDSLVVALHLDATCSGQTKHVINLGCVQQGATSHGLFSNMMCSSTGDIVLRSGAPAVPPSYP
eukprot:1455658-Amphidinium_carterae.1